MLSEPHLQPMGASSYWPLCHLIIDYSVLTPDIDTLGSPGVTFCHTCGIIPPFRGAAAFSVGMVTSQYRKQVLFVVWWRLPEGGDASHRETSSKEEINMGFGLGWKENCSFGGNLQKLGLRLQVEENAPWNSFCEGKLAPITCGNVRVKNGDALHKNSPGAGGVAQC